MKNFPLYVIFTLFLCFSFPGKAQDFSDDSLAVREILDANNLGKVCVDSVIEKNNGRITILILNTWKLYTLPPCIGKLTELEQLWLYNNHLTTLPKELENLVKLKILWINNNYLDTIVPDLGKLILLEDLAFYINDIRSISFDLGKLTKLKYLMFSSNQITEIPPDVGNLNNLELLWANNNQIKELPKEVGKLPRLEDLALDSNQLIELPEELGNCTSLAAISFRSNKIKTLPETIVNLKPKDECDFVRNKIHPKNISPDVKEWLDTYSPDWLVSQDTNRIILNSFSRNPFNLKIIDKPHALIISLPIPDYQLGQPILVNQQGRIVPINSTSHPYVETKTYTIDKTNIGTGFYYLRFSAAGRRSFIRVLLLE